MKATVTIKGKPVIDIYESYDGSYWFITEKCHKQDSVINGKVYKDDQILFGYARLSACPEFAEFGYISETELRLLSPTVWKVPKENWYICPEVEVSYAADKAALYINRSLKGGVIKMKKNIDSRIDEYAFLLEHIRKRFGDDEEVMIVLQEIRKDFRSENIQRQQSNNRNAPATESQVAYLKNLKATIPEGLTKYQASKLIDEILSANDNSEEIVEMSMRLP